MIRCSEPKAQYEAHRARIDAAIRRVLQSGWYLLGEELESFERQFAAFVGAQEAIGTASGTDALALAIRACDVGPGDEVITCSHTAVATVAAVASTGATPVLVDVEPDYFTLDPALLAAAVTPRTKAVIPVHLYGQPANMDAVLEFARGAGLRVIEDCAQAHGATWRGRRVGSLADAGCFSFYPTKNLGALGDAGMVVTSDDRLAERVRSLREYGWDANRVSQLPGGVSRMDEIQAAVLREKLSWLDDDNAARARLAEFYAANLAESPLMLPRVRQGARHVFHLYVVRTTRRDQLRAFLNDRGILAGVHYPVPVHLQPAYRKRATCASPMTVTEQLAREVLSLPIYPELTTEQAEIVRSALVSFYTIGSSP